MEFSQLLDSHDKTDLPTTTLYLVDGWIKKVTLQSGTSQRFGRSRRGSVSVQCPQDVPQVGGHAELRYSGSEEGSFLVMNGLVSVASDSLVLLDIGWGVSGFCCLLQCFSSGQGGLFALLIPERSPGLSPVAEGDGPFGLAEYAVHGSYCFVGVFWPVLDGIVQFSAESGP